MLRRVHDRCIVSARLRSPSTLNTLFRKAEDGVSWCLPVDAKLLHVNDSVSLNNLVDECADFMLIHGPNFVKTIFIAFFKALEFILKFLELLSELLIVIGQFDVISLEILRLSLKLFFNCSQNVLVASIFSFKRCYCVAVDLFSLL